MLVLTLLVLILFALSYVVLLLNSQYYWLNSSYKSNSLLITQQQSSEITNNLFEKIKSYFKTSNNWLEYFLIKNKLDSQIDHLVSCLNVLVVKTETPLFTALELIVAGLPDGFNIIAKEIRQILQKAEKQGLKEAITDWQALSTKFSDFLMLLTAIHEGASRIAIKDTIDKFLAKSKTTQEEAQKAQAENLQLYLLLPVLIMLLIAMWPLYDAINFLMKHSGVF